MEEILIMKDIPSMPGYAITEFGEVYSKPRDIVDCRGRKYTLKGRWRKQSSTQGGYRIISHRKGTKTPAVYVHRLVAEAFITNPDNKPEINHKDSNVTNNHYANLEWVTHSENMYHAFRTGSKVPTYKFDVITRKQILDEYLDYPYVGCIAHLAKKYDCDHNTITRIIKQVKPVTRFGRGLDKQKLNQIVERLNQLPDNCHRTPTLSKEFGIKYSTMKKWVKDIKTAKLVD